VRQGRQYHAQRLLSAQIFGLPAQLLSHVRQALGIITARLA
jgi:hypothetical protein